ncbi:hypothetical protein AWB78_06435 [Caballeronia calidae]|uniref:Uncharacterized protein n=1 Tax=Caballeronia calidae TaxID=1777139 RepID=A0A158EA75_9BURK|nr:hypothetical protein AWB78_06435 [Caballeronia calidae]
MRDSLAWVTNCAAFAVISSEGKRIPVAGRYARYGAMVHRMALDTSIRF